MANVTDEDRDVATEFIVNYCVRDMFGLTKAPKLELMDMLATARAEGRREGMEEAAAYMDQQARGAAIADSRRDSSYAAQCAARIREMAREVTP